MYNKILLAVDGSQNSKLALKHAVRLAEGNRDATVELIYVVNLNEMKITALQTLNQHDLNHTLEEKKEELDRLIKDSGIAYKVTILLGDAGPSIVDYANKNDFDVIVMGKRGLNPMQAFVLGSVSHQVIQRANCPVLIVK
ncbi:universal stress protein [Metabacillus fastidiosus]|uniref:universal stress protein n=1 Tax=Metabacillus fastidiosus TaxID=1458 RepID=UPI002E23150E|nr:universal stress protein [Metabacillus fastidiosus]